MNRGREHSEDLISFFFIVFMLTLMFCSCLLMKFFKEKENPKSDNVTAVYSASTETATSTETTL